MTLGFWLKKAISACLMPLPAALVLLAAGLWWARSEARRKRGLRLVAAGFALLYVTSLPPVAHLALAPLERGADGYVAAHAHAAGGGPAVAAIVALGAGYHPVPGRPLTGQVSGASVTRVAEAVRIARLHPTAAVHCSGWGGGQSGSNGQAACDLAVALGVAATRVVVHASPRDTEEEAAAVARVLRARGQLGAPVVLVTHAAHMPRAALLFRAAGLRVVPAPTGHVSAATPRWTLVPSTFALGTTTGAWHEWLGRAWLWLRGVGG